MVWCWSPETARVRFGNNGRNKLTEVATEENTETRDKCLQQVDAMLARRAGWANNRESEPPVPPSKEPSPEPRKRREYDMVEKRGIRKAAEICVELSKSHATDSLEYMALATMVGVANDIIAD